MRENRFFTALFIIFFVYIFFSARLFYLQVYRGEEISRMATNMRSKPISINEYSRGEILDRNHLLLSSTYSQPALYGIPKVIKERYRQDELNKDINLADKAFRDTASKLASKLDQISMKEIYDSLIDADKKGRYILRIKDSLSEEEIEKINNSDINGIAVAPIQKRYREDGFLAHVMGYVSGSEYMVGKSGVEKTYQDILSNARSSQELRTVLDAHGSVIDGLMFKISEKNLSSSIVVLSIDKRVQENVEKIMDKYIEKGAVIVMSIEEREILAMASRPSFNPYQVEATISKEFDTSLINRAINSYHPGSMFKLLVSIAALEENIIQPHELFYCDGEHVFESGVAMSCWYKEGHGHQNFSEAFANSCNPIFIEIAQRLGRDKILHYVERTHLTSEELEGLFPLRMNSYVRIDYGEAALGNAALGQHGILLSPLQIASLLASIGDDGYYRKPSLFRYAIDSSGNKIMPEERKTDKIMNQYTAYHMKQLLEKVVLEGTAKNTVLQEIRVAGKTATSETGRIDGDKKEIMDAWFGGYFPAESPQWVIVVLVEEGKSGAESAVPVFNEIVEAMLAYY